MRTFTAHIQSLLDSGAGTFATCWKMTLTNGTVLYFTDYHDDIVVGGHTYESGGSFSRTAVASTLGLGSDNMEISGAMGAPSITESDVLAGLYDNAQIEVFLVDYLSPSSGSISLCKGRLGEIKVSDNKFSCAMNGLSHMLTQSQVELYSPTCRAQLGDTRCKKSLTAHTWTTTVSSVTSQLVFDTGLSLAAGTLDGGMLTWTSGNNAGLSAEIKTQSATGLITLYLPAPYAIAASDALTVIRGCPKTLAACRDTFNNVPNFRGEPFLPGNDKILQVIAAKNAEIL